MCFYIIRVPVLLLNLFALTENEHKDNIFKSRFRQLADSGLLHSKQFRVGFGGGIWTHHTRLEGGLVALATIHQQQDSQKIDSLENWLQVRICTRIRIT